MGEASTAGGMGEDAGTPGPQTWGRCSCQEQGPLDGSWSCLPSGTAGRWAQQDLQLHRCSFHRPPPWPSQWLPADPAGADSPGGRAQRAPPAHPLPGWQQAPGGGEGPHQRAFLGERRGGLWRSARCRPWGCMLAQPGNCQVWTGLSGGDGLGMGQGRMTLSPAGTRRGQMGRPQP